MIWRLRNDEPSFSSMNEKSFESRRVRTQPWTLISSRGAALCNTSLICAGESSVILEIATFNAQRPALNFQIEWLVGTPPRCPKGFRVGTAHRPHHQLNGSQLPGCGGGFVPLRVRYVYSCRSRS